ncbi:MAG: DUF2178 domain-containing protein [Patescibacteria group bacterium]
MTAKKFLIYRLIVVMLLAGVVSSFVAAGNYLVPIAAVITALIFLLLMRKKVDEVLADERDYKIAGNAARYAMIIFSAISCIIILVLFALKKDRPDFELIGSILAYAVCGLMLLYSFIFKYYQRAK